MDEETRKMLEERLARFEVTMTPAAQKAMEQISQSVEKISSFNNRPEIFSPEHRMPVIPRTPTQEEINEYQSASVLMMALADEALEWKKRLPENYKPAILAVLYGGIQIHVHSLSQVSFHGIRIGGTMNGAPCSLLAHQSTVQLLCYGEEVNADAPRNPIGFVWDGNAIEI